MILVVGLLIFLIVVTLTGLAVYVHLRGTMREQKNYERGLKMVPMLIHLPPRSSDTEVGSRDARDVANETISQAETLYDIIASTTQKGFKTEFYGQRHFAFEIIAQEGFVHFYVAVPLVILSVVEQAILSSYPDAKLEQTSEHNIFSEGGGIDGVSGGELVLKEDYSHPIATFHELKRDTMQAVLNAMSTLEKEDGAALQILLRPAHSNWRSSAIEVAAKKSKKEKSSGFFGAFTSLDNWASWLGQALYAPFKVPEETSSEKKSDDPKLSGLDQALVDAIEEKTRHVGYEVAIRVIASSTTSQRAQSIASSLVATFALFDSPGKNGFKYSEAKDLESFVTAYIMRFFGPEMNENILNSIELATLFHFPDQNTIPTTQLERQASKQVDGPRNAPEEGIALGYNVFRGNKKKINISMNDRRRHVYVVGQTGTGKSTFLENLALQDMLEGGGFAFIDPHGDTAEKLLSLVPKERAEDIIYFCPADMDHPLGLNLFEFDHPDEQDFLIQESLNMLYKLYDPQKQGIIGPRFERIFTNAALLLMADPQGGTFVDIPKLLIDVNYMKSKLKYVKDKNVLEFWEQEWPKSQQSKDAGEVISWVVSKFGAFLSNEMMRNIIGQTKSSFSMRDIMDNKKILLVNLSKGRSGELNSKLLGMIFVMKFQAAAMSRASIPEEDRVDFSLYVDEFQNFSTDSFADILSEARKYRLKLVIANQFTTQLTQEIRDAVFGNVGTVISFRVGPDDADALVSQFRPSFTTDDLQRIPNYNMVVRMLIGGVPTQPFSMAGLPPLGNPNKELGDALKQLSAAKHGKPRALVEKVIDERLNKVTVPAKSAAGAKGRASTPQRRGAGTPQAKPRKPRSFIEDWNHKKKNNSFRAPAPRRNAAGSRPRHPSVPGTAAPQSGRGPAPQHARQSVPGQRPVSPRQQQAALQPHIYQQDPRTPIAYPVQQQQQYPHRAAAQQPAPAHHGQQYPVQHHAPPRSGHAANYAPHAPVQQHPPVNRLQQQQHVPARQAPVPVDHRLGPPHQPQR